MYGLMGEYMGLSAMDFITLLPPSFEGVANVADIPDYVHEA